MGFCNFVSPHGPDRGRAERRSAMATPVVFYAARAQPRIGETFELPFATMLFPETVVRCRPPMDIPVEEAYRLCHAQRKETGAPKSEVFQGTLDLMVLKVLDALGPQHSYCIARRIEQASEHVLKLNEGTVYTSLLRLQQRRWIDSD
jgi:hypothetical protein